MDVLALFRAIAHKLEVRGHVCHTGGAIGADKAFIDGAPRTTQLWLPFQNYNGYYSDLPEPGEKELIFAEKYHPKWVACNAKARLMHARNCNIVLGADLSAPVDYIVCWTPGGKLEGGTAQALRIAIDYDIPIFNFGDKRGIDATCDKLRKFVDFKYYNQFE